MNVGRFRADFVVARSGNAGAAARVEDSLREDLPALLSKALDLVVDNASDEVWLIRRLDFEADVNSRWNRERLASRLARSFARSLVDVMRHPSASGAVRFSSRARFLTQFLVDIADGSAWTKWYYRSFDGLRALPASAVIRTVLCESAERAKEILLLLEEAALARMLAAMDEEDVRAVARSLEIASASTAADAGRHVAGILADAAVRLDLERPEVVLLQLCLARMRATGRLVGREFVRLSEAVSHLAGLMNRSPKAYRAMKDGLKNGRISPDAAEADFGALFELEVNVRRAFFVLLDRRYGEPVDAPHRQRPRPDSTIQPVNHGGPELVRTAFGGIFLLLPILGRLPIADRPGRSLEDEPAENDALVRLLILVKCLGWDRRPAMLREAVLWKSVGAPVPTDAMGARRRIDRLTAGLRSSDAWRRWSERAVASIGIDAGDDPPDDVRSDDPAVNPAGPSSASNSDALLPQSLDRSLDLVASAMLRAFALGLRGFEASSSEYVRRNFLDLRASVQDDGERLIVRLGKTPLEYVLRRGGRLNQIYACSWLPGRRFELFPE